MRFRLATTGTGGQKLQEGIGSIFQAMAFAPLYQAQAADDAQKADMQRQVAQSQIGQHVADAALKRAQAASLQAAPDVLDTVIAGRAGTDVPTLQRWRDGIRTGMPAISAATGDAETDAAIGIPQKPAVDPAVASALLTQFQRMVPAIINPGDVKLQDMATAAGHYQEQDAIDRIAGNPGMAAIYGPAFAASKGKPLVDNIGDTGAGFNVFTGEGKTLDSGLRALYGDNLGAQATQRRAAANASNAAAGASAALTTQRGAQTDRIKGGYQKTTDIVDDDTGEVTVVRLPTGGEPVAVGVKPPKAGSGVDATNAKARNAVVAAVERDLKGATDAEIQAEVDRRMARRAPTNRAAASAPGPAAPAVDMTAAAKIKAQFAAGKITREQAKAQLQALGMK